MADALGIKLMLDETVMNGKEKSKLDFFVPVGFNKLNEIKI